MIITAGFGPIALISWAYALVSGSKHIPMTDAWLYSESHLGVLHRAIRYMVYKTSAAYIGASRKSLQLYNKYGIKGCNFFKSCLCIDNKRFIDCTDNATRPYDIMYSGQIIDLKNPNLFTDIVKKVNKKYGILRVLIIGDGILRENFIENLTQTGADVTYAGFVPQEELPHYYSKAKLLLFTTKRDAWGIVVNEALSCGTPVIITPYAGAANELIINGENGYVLEPNSNIWSERVIEILQNPLMLEEMRKNATNSIKEYNFENAAMGIIGAVEHVCKE